MTTRDSFFQNDIKKFLNFQHEVNSFIKTPVAVCKVMHKNGNYQKLWSKMYTAGIVQDCVVTENRDSLGNVFSDVTLKVIDCRFDKNFLEVVDWDQMGDRELVLDELDKKKRESNLLDNSQEGEENKDKKNEGGGDALGIFDSFE